MTETKSNTLSTIKSLLLDILSQLNDSYFHRAEIDQQCQARFGKSWSEVRTHIMQAASNVEFAPGSMIDPDRTVKGIGLAGGTRNWMTNKYLGVLYLHFIRTPRNIATELTSEPGKPIEVKEVSLDSLIGSSIFNNVVKAIESGADTKFLNECNPLYWDLLRIAEKVLPEEVGQVLKSHGL